MKKRLLSLISAMALCFTAMPSYAVAEDTDDDIYEYELMLSCSETHFYDDDDTLTYFYVDTDYEGETITLVDADTLTEYTMVDDGKFSISGDDVPYDGVYTTKIELDTTMTSFSKEYHFYAVADYGSTSNPVTIKITKKITDAQIKEMASVDEAISTLQSTKNYKSADNDERITMLYELLSELAENGTEQYPYSLIQKDSIRLSDDKKMYTFNYYFGLASGKLVAVTVNEDIMTVSVVDYDTGELILTDTTEVWAITLQAGFSVEYALTAGTSFAWGTEWIDLGTWSYGQRNPCEIDTSSYGTGFGTEGFQVVDMYIPDGYFLPEDYLEMNYKESDTEHTDFPSDITIKLKKTTMGDVNDDGAFNVSDVVLLQKWLLAVPDTHLANWKAANFCDDDRLNVFDLCLMKRALIEQRQQRQITVENIISLSKKGYDLTVADFAPFKGEDIGSGLYVMKYEVAGREDQYYLLVGSDGADKPDYAKLVNIENDGKWDEIDIRSEEFQNAAEIYENWNKGTDTEENRASARTLGDYALEKLKDGTYSLDTVIDSENASELMDEGTAALMDKDEFTSMEFLDEHTVMINLNYGLLGVQGYLVTDGTLTFEPDTQVSVPDNGFDGNVINIEWADGNLYYFTAGL